MATKTDLSDLNGDYRVEFVRIEHRFESIEDTMRSMQDVLLQILERLDGIESRLDRLESSNARIIGFQTSGRSPDDDNG